MYPAFDPGASLRIWAVETTLGGRVLRVPPLPAADWLPVLMRTEDPLAVRAILDDVPIAEDIAERRYRLGELKAALTELIEAATGRSARGAWSIAGAAQERWDAIGADMARVGVRFDRVPIGAALDALYGSIMRHLNEEGQAAFTRLLMEPKPVERPVPKNVRPLPASAAQYAQIRPKTVLRRPQDRRVDPSVQPTPPPQKRAGSVRPSVTGRRMPDAGSSTPGPPQG